MLTENINGEFSTIEYDIMISYSLHCHTNWNGQLEWSIFSKSSQTGARGRHCVVLVVVHVVVLVVVTRGRGWVLSWVIFGKSDKIEDGRGRQGRRGRGGAQGR